MKPSGGSKRRIPIGFLLVLLLIGIMVIRSVRDVAAATRGRRLERGLTQDELARLAGVSRKWVYEFEAGKPTVAFTPILRVLDVLGLTFRLGPTPESDGDIDRLLRDRKRGA